MRQGFRNLISALHLLNPENQDAISFIDLNLENGSVFRIDSVRVTPTDIYGRNTIDNTWLMTPIDTLVSISVGFKPLPDGKKSDLPQFLELLHERKSDGSAA
jgi:hypothetical protein